MNALTNYLKQSSSPKGEERTIKIATWAPPTPPQSPRPGWKFAAEQLEQQFCAERVEEVEDPPKVLWCIVLWPPVEEMVKILDRPEVCLYRVLAAGCA